MRIRTLLLIVLASLSSMPLNAQDTTATETLSIRKGKILLGTYFEFQAGTVEKTRVNRPGTSSDLLSASINITVGKMLSDKWGILLLAGYSQTNVTTPIPGSPTGANFATYAESYSIAPAVRYYAPISEEVWFFLQGAAFISRGKSSEDEIAPGGITTIKLNTRGWGFGISPGISYFLTDKLSSELSIGLLGYSVLSGDDGLGNETTARTFQSLLYLNSVSLGFVYYL
jgi:mannose-6-phosphate isomerase-like protein (cupin superfamily)